MRCPHLFLAFCLAVPLAAQTGTSGQPELEAAIAATSASIRAQCPHPAPENRSALLRDELRLSDVAQGAADAESWHRLGCVRALLYAADAISRAGLHMPIGMSWHEGAVLTLLKGLELEPSHSASTELLGELAMAEMVGADLKLIAAALVRATQAGARGPLALRACSDFARREGLAEESVACGTMALEAGVDSTWQLVHLARMAFAAHDTASGQRLFHRATATAADSADWATIGWHLRWFLEPEEANAWKMLTDSLRPAWVRDRFASRDVRDGRPIGSRLAEHFARLEAVDTMFERRLPRRGYRRFMMAATQESGLEPELVGGYWEPGLVAARPFRFYMSPYPGYDDRAAVWMRFGPPLRRIVWSGIDTAKARRDSNYHVNHREVWRYRVDKQYLLLSFEAEAFDGSAEASRLVAGVLGSYLCDVDSHRCNLTHRASTLGGVPPEAITELQQDDEQLIVVATTRDDNSLRPEHPIATVAQFSRVWDPRSGAVLAVIPYAVKVGDVERSEDSTGVTATLALTLRQWDAAAASWQSTDVMRRLRLPARLRNSSHLTGYLVTPTSAGTTAWSLVASQGAERSGRAWGDRLAPLGAGELTMSDLVVGAASQGQTWTTTGGTQVPLGPLGAFDNDEPVSLYWQVRSRMARDPVRITIALFRAGPRDSERPVLEVAFDGRLDAGLNEWQRNIGVAELDGGTYRVEVTVRDGELSAVRSARVLLR